MTYAAGVEYTGNWHQGKRHGLGTMRFADGSQYVGEWKAGTMDGTGKYTAASGAYYEGAWKNGLVTNSLLVNTHSPSVTVKVCWSRSIENGTLENSCRAFGKATENANTPTAMFMKEFGKPVKYGVSWRPCF